MYPGRVFSPVLFLLAEVPNKTKHVPIVDDIVEKLLIKKRTFFKIILHTILARGGNLLPDEISYGECSLSSQQKTLLTSG